MNSDSTAVIQRSSEPLACLAEADNLVFRERPTPTDGTSPLDRLRRAILAACAAFAIGLWFTSFAGAAAPTLIERLVKAQGPLQSKQDEPVDAHDSFRLVDAVAGVAVLLQDG